MKLLQRPAVSLSLALFATAVALSSLLSIAAGGSAPGWSHFWCSPAALRSAAHSVGSSRLGAGVITALEVHWPHFLPALLGLATLVYLWRANARFNAQANASSHAQE
jgi:hypothetical protein